MNSLLSLLVMLHAQTGDSSKPFLVAICFIVSIVLMVVLILTNKSQDDDGDDDDKDEE